jgi:hypothetical protein
MSTHQDFDHGLPSLLDVLHEYNCGVLRRASCVRARPEKVQIAIETIPAMPCRVIIRPLDAKAVFGNYPPLFSDPQAADRSSACRA